MEARDSEDLTRVGPGTAMGALMRQYWLPALASSELKADGDPVRLVLLGEKLIAFRDTSGRVGVMDHRCPHRCASLFLGRNEENGIRCVYHGWKFDAAGNCVDMPSVPPNQDFKHKVKAKAYRTAERNGLVWVFMGDRAELPPLPPIEATLLPEDELSLSFVQRECNWLQALEGDIDTAHFGFLHAGSVGPDDFQDDHPMRHTVLDRAPEYHVKDTSWGTAYAAYRPDGEQVSWRFANFLFPFWTQAPNGTFGNLVAARAWVPMDDGHTMVVLMGRKNGAGYSGLPLKNGKPMPGFAPRIEYLPNTTDWYGRWRPAANAGNDYQIDRDAQRRNEIYTGIRMVFMQDQAVTESMGPITDHGFEHLVASDLMVARTRRRLLRAARELKENGTLPPGAADPEVFFRARSGAFHTAKGSDWWQAYEDRAAAAMKAGPQVTAAE